MNYRDLSCAEGTEQTTKTWPHFDDPNRDNLISWHGLAISQQCHKIREGMCKFQLVSKLEVARFRFLRIAIPVPWGLLEETGIEIK